MKNDNNQNNADVDMNNQKSFEKSLHLLGMQLLGVCYPNTKKRKAYCNNVALTMASHVFGLLMNISKKRLITHLKTIENHKQANQSKKCVTIIFDKTSDGERHGKKQTHAYRQYTGSYGIIKTHGWFFLAAYIGNDVGGEIIYLGASLYIKGTSEPEWKEGNKLLEVVGKWLDDAGIPRDYVTVVGDNTYMCDDSQKLLQSNGWIYVGKAGGNRDVELDGKNGNLAYHSRRFWYDYKMMNETYAKKTGIKQYKRYRHEQEKVVYFHGLYEKKYEHWKYPKRFLVTNKLEATGQYTFLKYHLRWNIECYFKCLKQVCGWREYHPHTSGNKYLVHTGIGY